MKIITFINEKGGVGKTTNAVHVAAGLAIRGQRTVLIDADPQGHATVSLDVSKRPALYDLIVNERAWDDVLTTPLPRVWAGEFEAGAAELWLLPGNVQTQAIPIVTDPTLTLMERLSTLDGWADVVVIDTPPTPSALQTMIYVATSHLIYPTTCDSLSLDGLAETVARLQRLNRTRHALGLNSAKIIGVLPTMYEARTVAHRHGLDLVKKHFGSAATLPPVSLRTIWRDAAYARKTMFSYSPDHPATDEIWEIIDRIEHYDQQTRIPQQQPV